MLEALETACRIADSYAKEIECRDGSWYVEILSGWERVRATLDALERNTDADAKTVRRATRQQLAHAARLLRRAANVFKGQGLLQDAYAAHEAAEAIVPTPSAADLRQQLLRDLGV